MRRWRADAALAVLAIALGIALGYAVQLINGSAVGEFEQALRVLAGDADLTVQGPRSGFAESLYPAIARHPAVGVASPVVEIEARTAGRSENLRVLGLDVFRAALIQPALVSGARDVESRLDHLRPDRVFLSQSAARWLGVSVGDTLQLQSGGASARFEVAGLLDASAVRERLAVIDIAAAQTRLGRPGSLSRIELRLHPGMAPAAAMQALQSVLPDGVTVQRTGERIERNASLSRAYRVNLQVLALVAVFTGALLVFSSQALAVVRRRSEFALLRALGVTRGGIVRKVLGEAAVLGALGALLGLAAGHGLATWVLGRYGADLGAGFFRSVEASPVLNGWTLLGFAVIGVTATVGGSLAAAREAAAAQPAQALRAGDEQHAFSAIGRVWPGVLLALVGGALTLAPPMHGLPVAGYSAIALMLLGTLLLMPHAAQAVFRLAPRVGPPSARLALEQLRGAPGPAGASLAAIVASVALTTSMAIMVDSFRQSLDEWLGRMLPADLYVRVPVAGDGGLIPPALEARIAALPGVRQAQFTRLDEVILLASHAPVSLLVRNFDPALIERQLVLTDDSPGELPMRLPPVWVSEALADTAGLRKGDELFIPISGHNARFVVAGVWRDYVRQQGAVLIERSAYEAAGGATGSNEAALSLDPGADATRVEAGVKALFPPGVSVDVAARGALRALSLRIFDRTFAVTYALEAAAVLIGLAALASSFGALALARRREFGVLRHLGMTRRQVGAMLAFEGTLVSAVGLGAGLMLGWVMSLVLVHVVNRQSFHWSMDVHLPAASLAQFALAMLALASAAAYLGARRAMSGDAVRAVSEAW